MGAQSSKIVTSAGAVEKPHVEPNRLRAPAQIEYPPSRMDQAPVYCRACAYDLFARALADLDSDDGLVLASCALSMHELDDVNPPLVGQMLASLADEVRSRVKGPQPDALLAHLHQVLFEEHGFTGNTADYYSPTNSYLPEVLVTKRGIPITLSLIYYIVARRIGLSAWGINAPGHFLTGVQVNGASMIIDPFAGGRMMTRDEAIRRIEEEAGQSVPDGVDVLSVANHRRWISRMLKNLETIFAATERQRDVEAVRELAGLMT
jgi:regulator of sirC expression with transglutaminase-like and TPR domain